VLRDQIGECTKLLFERGFILSLTFQPAAFTGYDGAHFAGARSDEHRHNPDVVRGAVERCGGRSKKTTHRV
jgi:7,8-dihydro-6-hydroxymethylpterin dimethyltransferase